MNDFRVASYNRKVEASSNIDDIMLRYSKYPASLLNLIPNEQTEFREQFDALVPKSVVSNIEGLVDRTQSLKEGLSNYLENPDWIEKSFMEIQDFVIPLEQDLEKIEKQLNRFRNTDYYPKYIISSVTKMVSGLGWLQQWLQQLFKFLSKIIELSP